MGKFNFLDIIKFNESEEDYDDDLFDEDDEDDNVPFFERTFKSRKDKYEENDYYDESIKHSKSKSTRVNAPSKLVSINSRSNRSTNQVYVIKPKEFNDSQTAAEYLKNGMTIVFNMEGIEVNAAQRIIDFIGGACFALNGSIHKISSNIVIAAPSNTEITGNLKEEILNQETFSPDLTMF